MATNPILRSPYEEPLSHVALDDEGRSTDEICEWRRPSEAQTGIPGGVGGIDMVEPHHTINKLRAAISKWRKAKWPSISRGTWQLLEFWTSDSGVVMRPFWCQVEAIETAIWLYEAVDDNPELHKEVLGYLGDTNAKYNGGIPRRAFKVATGAGKTNIMAMFALWFAVKWKRYNFLVITPNLTVQDGVSVLKPEKDDKLWKSVTPPGLHGHLGKMRWTILNFQKFQKQDRLSMDGSATNLNTKTKRLLGRGKELDAWIETDKEMLDRLLRYHDAKAKFVVFNDEAHHCYHKRENMRVSKEEMDDAEDAELWFNALKALHGSERLFSVLDFSATPIWLSRPPELVSDVFPWTVSDYPLLDAIESGLVKIPRVPVKDDAESHQPKYRNIYEHNEKSDLSETLNPRVKEPLMQLYDHYKKETSPKYESSGIMPIFIIVANKIKNAKALYRWIAGRQDNGSNIPGQLGMLSNFNADGTPRKNPPTLLVHSKLFDTDTKREDNEIINELANLFKIEEKTIKDKKCTIQKIFMTAGKKGEPGERIRCVISVGMLTEGWDAKNVTHVFGYRKFDSILLCEQVTGRALRRTSFSLTDEKQTEEYANVFGVPYTFARGGETSPLPPVEPWKVYSMPERSHLKIVFPNVENYVGANMRKRYKLDTSKVPRHSVPKVRPTVTESTGPLGDSIVTERDARAQSGIWETATHVALILDPSGEQKSITFADSLQAVKEWLNHSNVKCSNPADLPHDERAKRMIADACVSNDERASIIPIFADMHDPSLPRVSSTDGIEFETTLKHRYDAKNSELNAAACHTQVEMELAKILDEHELIDAWVRNHQLGFFVPWYDKDLLSWRRTEPDFIARTKRKNGNAPINLVIEFKGMKKGESSEEDKKYYLEEWWAPSVSNYNNGEYGKWKTVWIEDIGLAPQLIAKAYKNDV